MDSHPAPLPARRARLLRGGTGLLGGLLLLTVCAAVVVGAAVVGAGLVAKQASDRFLALPAELRPAPLPQRSVLLDARGRPFAWFWEEDRLVVPLSSVAPLMRQALVDIEDERFYENPGVDLRAVGRAVLRDQASSVTGDDAGREGASTLTQQYVKNLRLAQARTRGEQDQVQAETYARKAQEARYALQLSRTTSKDAILEGYLNLVYFGNGAYGVQAAAERYFGLDAADLTLPQAALLAGLVKNPTALDPTRNPRDALARRDVVLGRMLALGHVTPEQHARATAAPVGLRPGGPRPGCHGASGYACDHVLHELLQADRLGPTVAARRRALETGGLTVHTTFEPTVQQAAADAVRRARGSRAALAAAVVQPGTGRVLALAGSVPFGVAPGSTSVNLPLGGSSGFQAGSTFKVFVLAQALVDGVPLDLELDAPQVYVGSDNGKPYPVRNASDSESGVFSLEEATWHSVNTWYMQLQERTGVARPAALAEAMGVRRADGGPLRRVPSFTLGTNEVSPLALAGAYATLAARGRHCPPHAVTRVRAAAHPGPGGTAAPGVRTGVVPAPPCRRVLPAAVADQVTRLLAGVVTRGTGRAADPGRPAAGKTGTVQDYSAAWFAGYTPQLAAAVWMGDPRGGYRHPLRDVTVDGTTYPQVYGGGVPAQTWRALVAQALRGTPVKAFPAAPPPSPAS